MQSVLPEDRKDRWQKTQGREQGDEKEGRDRMGIMFRGLERHCHNVHTRP